MLVLVLIWLKTLKKEPTNLNWKWLDELADTYDCWDIDKDSPRALLYDQEPTDVAIPNWIDLQDWIKYRLIKALEVGTKEELHQALTTTRKWAQIMFTSEQLVGEMVGLAILKFEREAMEEGQNKEYPYNGPQFRKTR